MAIKMAKKEKLNDGVRFAFADDKETVLTAKLDDFTPDIVRQLAIHGLSQKVGDSYASSETVSDAIESAQSVVKNLKEGNFNARVQGSGGMVAEAIARLKGISLEEAQDALRELDEEARAKVAKNPQVKATIEVIKGERAVAKLKDSPDLDFDLPKGKKEKK